MLDLDTKSTSVSDNLVRPKSGSNGYTHLKDVPEDKLTNFTSMDPKIPKSEGYYSHLYGGGESTFFMGYDPRFAGRGWDKGTPVLFKSEDDLSSVWAVKEGADSHPFDSAIQKRTEVKYEVGANQTGLVPNPRQTPFRGGTKLQKRNRDLYHFFAQGSGSSWYPVVQKNKPMHPIASPYFSNYYDLVRKMVNFLYRTDDIFLIGRILLYRGCKFKFDPLMDPALQSDEVLGAGQGNVKQINILASTTLNIRTARTFLFYDFAKQNQAGTNTVAGEMSEDDKDRVAPGLIAVIEVVRNSKVPVLVPGGAYQDHKFESEVILPPGTRVRYVKEWIDDAGELDGDVKRPRVRFRHFQVLVAGSNVKEEEA